MGVESSGSFHYFSLFTAEKNNRIFSYFLYVGFFKNKIRIIYKGKTTSRVGFCLSVFCFEIKVPGPVRRKFSVVLHSSTALMCCFQLRTSNLFLRDPFL